MAVPRLLAYPASLAKYALTPVLRAVSRARPGQEAPALDTLLQTLLARFDRHRPVGVAREPAELVARTDALNEAAERYFTTFSDTAFLLNKPFSDTSAFSKHLFSLGVLLEGLRLRTTDVVVELGAGSCWASHFLNRFGCRTISLDVSRTALSLGEELFRRDPGTRWDLKPEFHAYDGHAFPLPDGCCSKVLVVDAFHHIPNQREILTEMARILGPDGIVAMSEPGVGHAGTEASKHEVREYGVLENELVLEDVAALAQSCGFREVRVVVASPHAFWEIPASDLGAFIQGKGFTAFWDNQANGLLASHYILMYKGDPSPTTRQPRAVGARIEVPDVAGVVQATAGEPVTLRVTLLNTSETKWLHGERPDGGWTRLGAHLYRERDGVNVVVDFDWFRAELPRDMPTQDRTDLTVTLPALSEPGLYHVVFDMVIEGFAWFGERGSSTTTVTVQVVGP